MFEEVAIARVAKLPALGGETVRLQGWLFNARGKGKLIFLLLRDGSGICQCVVSAKNVSEEDFQLAKGLTQESSFEVVGVVQLDERAPGGA
jgi:asparaginyl-tRNA synthetase